MPLNFDVPQVLCHPDGEKSCGACCGMYNHVENDHLASLARLHTRTVAFRREVGDLSQEELQLFRARWEETRRSAKLQDGLPICPFLGLLDVERADHDPEGARIGCMVHPLQNNGQDGREYGVYDQETCRDYLCAAHGLLRNREKWLVIEAVEDSYLYGLVITDVTFVKKLFELATDMNAADPSDERIARPAAVEAASRYFELKRDWPFGTADRVFGQLCAGEGLETPRRSPPADSLGAQRRPIDAVLRCLGSEISSVDELEAARKLAEDRIRDFADAVRV